MEGRMEYCSIEFENMNLGQMLYVQAVVMPELVAVMQKYAKDIADLEVSEYGKI